jgi:hypothetical protein
LLRAARNDSKKAMSLRGAKQRRNLDRQDDDVLLIAHGPRDNLLRFAPEIMPAFS